MLDADGTPVPAGTEGRLFFEDLSGRGFRYHNDPAKTASASRELHFKSGADWRAYNEQYGVHNATRTVLEALQRAARVSWQVGVYRPSGAAARPFWSL